MPAKPRSAEVDPSISGLYHLYTRCVRRAHLFGEENGKDYSHRREWVRERVEHLAKYFAIDISFMALMSNHFHFIIRNLPNLVETWTDDEVIRRACKIFPYKFERLGVKDGEPTLEKLKDLTDDSLLVMEMRKRLADPSWFARQLNQYIATKANREDDCTGHFFEGRFKCKRIKTIFQLVICGLYLDLNEIAAGMADCPEEATGSSAYFRIVGRNLRAEGASPAQLAQAMDADGFLNPVFRMDEPQGYPPAGEFGSCRASDSGLIDMTFELYLDVLKMLIGHFVHGKRRPEKQPIPQKAVAKLLRAQNVLPRISSDLGD